MTDNRIVIDGRSLTGNPHVTDNLQDAANPDCKKCDGAGYYYLVEKEDHEVAGETVVLTDMYCLLCRKCFDVGVAPPPGGLGKPPPF